MKKGNRRERTFDKDKTFTIALSVAVALVLWSYVMIQVNPTKQETIYRVPVSLLNEQTLTEKELAILGDGDYTVDITVEGKRSVVDSLKLEEVYAEIQLFGWGKGENYISVDVSVPSDLKIVQVKPDKIKVNIEDLVTVSKAVTVIFEGDFPKDTEESEMVTRPSEIEIKGAKSAVESVNEIVVVVNTGDLSPNGIQVTREITALNKDQMAVESVKLSSSHVSVLGKLLYKKEVTLISSFTGAPGENRETEIEVPETIIIKGEKEKIDQIEEIEAEAVNLADYPAGGLLQLKPILPEGIELSKDNPKISAKLKVVDTASLGMVFPGEALMAQGLKQGLTLRAVHAENSVEISGEKSFIEGLSQNQLKFFVAAEGLEPGEYNLPLFVVAEGNTGKITVKPSEITVIIENISQENAGE